MSGSRPRWRSTQRPERRWAAAQRDVTIEGREEGATVAIAVRDAGAPTCGEQGNWRQPAWWDRRRYDAEVTLAIQVPRDVRVRLCTVNGGEAVVDGTQGDFDVSNVNGRIVLKGMRGSGRATTVNGTIEAAFDAAPRAESLFKTVNGDITVTLPAIWRPICGSRPCAAASTPTSRPSNNPWSGSRRDVPASRASSTAAAASPTTASARAVRS